MNDRLWDHLVPLRGEVTGRIAMPGVKMCL